jgi:hypothetical protein
MLAWAGESGSARVNVRRIRKSLRTGKEYLEMCTLRT